MPISTPATVPERIAIQGPYTGKASPVNVMPMLWTTNHMTPRNSAPAIHVVP